LRAIIVTGKSPLSAAVRRERSVSGPAGHMRNAASRSVISSSSSHAAGSGLAAIRSGRSASRRRFEWVIFSVSCKASGGP
jgi:hypothetical protein